ncbi:PQQ-like domain-containing protein [Streptomyces sp. LaPpAH-199]|uniref:outer membrane protein assembly factor BamB family protein n=1 Tax=Streptomyces TaxID=1883 RepID=UPI00087EFA33|nr:PQQ-binding-like beta-propeller repeat protein [Streptomyces sp. LaPpAH-199]SDE31889.1 PQQ-like domain-containing protein [Streptomyces sp. LaPpAH-199]
MLRFDHQRQRYLAAGEGELMRARQFCLIALLAIGLSACGSSADRGPADRMPSDFSSKGSAEKGRPERVPHDPPESFTARGAVALPPEATAGRTDLLGDVRDLAVALHRTSAYVASADRMQTVDLTTGKLVAVVRPRAEALGEDDDATAPFVSADGSLVVTTFVTRQPGIGTQSPSMELEVVATTPETGKAAWSTSLKFPRAWAEGDSSTPEAQVVGFAVGNVIVTVNTGYNAVTAGIDIATHQVRWTAQNVRTRAVTAEAAVGVDILDGFGPDQLVGLDPATGKEKWRAERNAGDTTVESAGPSLVRAWGWAEDGGARFDRLLKSGTGKVQADVPKGLDNSSCPFDQAQTLVCTSQSLLVALDSTSGKEI